jgi:hypothetical protein
MIAMLRSSTNKNKKTRITEDWPMRKYSKLYLKAMTFKVSEA